MVIYNVAQATFIFQKGVKIKTFVQGRNNNIGVLFDKYDDKLKPALAEWGEMCKRNREKKGLVKPNK